jgi:hypothetical protein
MVSPLQGFSSMRATCSAHHIFDFAAPTGLIFGDKNKPWNSSLSNSLQPLILSPYIQISILFSSGSPSQTPTIASLNIRDQVPHLYKTKLYCIFQSLKMLLGSLHYSIADKTHADFLYRIIHKEVYTFKNLFYKYYWTYGDVLYTDWRENSQSYFHTLHALDVSLTCDAADVTSIIQLFSQSSQHVTGNNSHSLCDMPLQIIDIRTLTDFLSIRTKDMDLTSVVFVKYIFESVYFFLNNPV